ncbi:hypothetical protein O6H91_03G042500 [Diphasiastrum complanatum]|uniref:Uncharacterized protein n=2 Tax=Diphasiastrum complanatum TaxID=34168 RepID=A0ACC2E5Y4_DIPCM|nr:hypothetical protein O6H91_03G024000 [Diphasiastrum complanatum]KAJ7561817.1 hypothetical protein O6H91_03G042500 [Diphasiastrum complanatum]
MAEERVRSYVRLATARDVPIILALIRQLADFERLTHLCVATEKDLAVSLFNRPPFQGPSVLLLEISKQLACNALDPSPKADESKSTFNEIAKEWTLKGVEDEEAGLFKSLSEESRLVVGFVLFFPNYSTFLGKPGIYIEDLYVRQPYRRQGFGKLLLETVAEEAVKRGAGRVEWCVLDWNVNAINFYEGLGATLLHDWRICRLSGDALEKYRN